MSTYSAITSGQIDAESPLDTTLAGQWTNNVLAMFEGASGAPRLQYGALATDVNPWHTLATFTPSAAADVQLINGVSGVVFDSTYDEYRLKWKQVAPATDGAFLRLRFTEDGGSTWISTSVYTSPTAAAATTYLQVSGAVGNAANEWATGEIVIENPTGLNQDKVIKNLSSSYLDTAGAHQRIPDDTGVGAGLGMYARDNVIDGIQMYFNTGNIASGTVILQGRRAY